MALQNFVDYTTPAVDASWLNEVDQAINGSGTTQGAALIPYTPPGTGAVATTVGAALSFDGISVFDFMTAAQIADVQANTLTLDCTAAIQAAINSLPQAPYTLSGSYVLFPPTYGGGTVFFPAGSYKVTSSLVIPLACYKFRLTGAGWGSAINMVGATSFDLITFAATPAGIVNLIDGVIDNLSFVGAGAVSGSRHLINTQYVGALQLINLHLRQIPTGGNGINVVGNPVGGTTYSHDLLIQNIYYETTTGNSIIYLGNTSSDSIISTVVGNGNAIGGLSSADCQYGIYIDVGAAHHKFYDCHPYGHALNALYLGANAGGHWFTGCRFEAGLADSAALVNTFNNVFTTCIFSYPPATFSAVSISNSTHNRFTNCVFLSGINTSFALKETGTSNYNTFGSFVVEGSFASNAFNLVGSASAVRPGGTDVTFNGGPLAITAGATIYLTSGSSADSISGAPVLYEGYATQLIVECSTAPGVGQTFVATFLINGVASALTTTISGTNFFNSATTVVYVGPGVSVVLQVVASAGAAASNIRSCFVINS